MGWSWANEWEGAGRGGTEAMPPATGVQVSAGTYAEGSSWGNAGASGWSHSTVSTASPGLGSTWSSWGSGWDGKRSDTQPKAEEAEGPAGGSASSLPPRTPLNRGEWRTSSWAGGTSWAGDGSVWGSSWRSWEPRCGGRESACAGLACAEVDSPKAVNHSSPVPDIAPTGRDLDSGTIGCPHPSAGAEAADGRSIGVASSGDLCVAAPKPSGQRTGGRSVPPRGCMRSPSKPEGGRPQDGDPVAEQEFEVLFLGGQMVKVPKKKAGPALGSRSGGPSSSKGAPGQSRRLLVSGLSSTTTADSLAAHFSAVGRVLHASLVAGSASGRVELADEDGALRASSDLNGSLLDGSKITIQMPTATTAARSKSAGSRFTSAR